MIFLRIIWISLLSLPFFSCMFGNLNTETGKATLVLGQSNFTTSTNNAGASGSNAVADSLSHPKGIFFDGTKLFIADTGNNRVLIWNSNPNTNKKAANVVMGQADMTGASGNRGGAAAANTLSSPTSVFVSGGRVFIADTGNNRILIFNSIPTTDGANADRVVGQQSMTETRENQGGTPSSKTLLSPTDVYYDGDKMVVADSGNRRVLIYNGLPANTSQEAQAVVGQTAMDKSDNLAPAANTLKNPNGVYITSDKKLIIADTGNFRVLIFNSIPNGDNASANFVIGQTSMTTGGSGTSKTTLSSPTDVYANGDSDLMIADQGNSRVLVYASIPASNGASANSVMGQANFDSSQGNRGAEPDTDTLNKPSGVFTNGSTQWVVDTENNRALRYSD